MLLLHRLLPAISLDGHSFQIPDQAEVIRVRRVAACAPLYLAGKAVISAVDRVGLEFHVVFLA